MSRRGGRSETGRHRLAREPDERYADWRSGGGLIRSADRRWRFRDPSMQLSGDSDRRKMIATDEFGMSEYEGRGERERDQQNQGDSREAAIRDRFPFPGCIDLFGPMLAGM